MKLDGNAAKFRNEIQELTTQKDDLVRKNKALRREKKGNVLALCMYRVLIWKSRPTGIVSWTEHEDSTKRLNNTVTD